MRYYLPIVFSICMFNASAQQAAYFDAAQAYNKLIIDKRQGELTRVGIYKVSGSPFLYGNDKEGYIFQTRDSGRQAILSYNTYTKEITFTARELPGTRLTKEPGSVDSFIIKADPAVGLSEDIHFIYGPLLGTKEKTYFQLISTGAKQYSLYKRYSSGLQVVPDNYSQPDLRQFNITVDYYYADPDKKGLTRLKPNVAALKSEFPKTAGLEKAIDAEALVISQETELKKIFVLLNNN